MKKLTKRSKKGFTLVELIVVIAILAILAGVAIPVYSGYIKKANEAADYQQLDAIKTAAVFAATDKAIPAGFTLTEIDVATTTTGDVTTVSEITVKGTVGATAIVYTDDAATVESTSTGLDHAVRTLLGGTYPTIKSDTFKSGAVYKQVGGEWKWDKPAT